VVKCLKMNEKKILGSLPNPGNGADRVRHRASLELPYSQRLDLGRNVCQGREHWLKGKAQYG